MTVSGEQNLMQRARNNDTFALGMIYDTYSPALYRYAYRLLGDQSLAEDCVAETFSRFLKALHGRQAMVNFLKAYLFRIAHNWITDYYRRHTPVMVELDESMPGQSHEMPETQVDGRLEKQQIRLALRALTPDQRQVVILKFYEGWQNEEVAAALQKPVGAVKALQHRALESLRKSLTEVQKVSQP